MLMLMDLMLMLMLVFKALFTWSRVPETTLSPELPWARKLFTYFFEKFNRPFTCGCELVPEKRDNSGKGTEAAASCLTSAGRVTLADGTTSSHINTLARLPKTTHGVSRFQ